ncbi:PREDICTED: uncharacterized protein LOC109342341 [Lupinus angustifolius]|uniref:uncharacterized protein LOC109342341 n=1 Tax=Lupinus angustifolius TaxID=3871 RepID=UPI00092EB9FE|nr:PREDICTED: uncharacterized protein LOC109342341 [Lupinus angustifolius]
MATATDPSSPPPSHSSAPPIRAVSPSLSLPIPSTKLSEKNYLTWSQFMVSVLKSNRAIRFIHPTDIPPKFLSEFDCNHHQINPSYLSWEEQDQTVFAWILNSISDSLHTRVIGCTSSSQLWDELHSFCNAHTKARSRQLRAQLRTIIQGNNTI